MAQTSIRWQERYGSGESPKVGDIVKRSSNGMVGEVRNVNRHSGRAICRVNWQNLFGAAPSSAVDADSLVLLRRADAFTGLVD